MASDGKRMFPHSGTSGKLLQLLSLKRPKKTTNWNKCLICQSTNSKETLRQASANGMTTFKEVCSRRRDDVFERLSSDIEHTSTMQVLWHGTGNATSHTPASEIFSL